MKGYGRAIRCTWRELCWLRNEGDGDERRTARYGIESSSIKSHAGSMGDSRQKYQRDAWGSRKNPFWMVLGAFTPTSAIRSHAPSYARFPGSGVY